MSSRVQAALARLKTQVEKDLYGLNDFRADVRRAAHATRDFSDASMATMLALGAMPMHQHMIRHRRDAEAEFSQTMALIRVPYDQVPIPVLVRVTRGLLVTMIERCARPPADVRPEVVASRLGTAGMMMSLLEKVDDTTHLLQLDGKAPLEATIATLERHWREDFSLRGHRTIPLLSRLYKRFSGDVQELHGMVLREAVIEKSWDHNARHDYRASFIDLAQAAMDAALSLEHNFEDRVFGPQETTDVA